MNTYKAYINDDYIQIKNKKTIKIKSDAISNGIIINRKQFIEDYKKVIKDKNFLSAAITILLNKIIDDQDIIYYTNIFEELNYSKIIIESTNNYLHNNILIPNKNIYILYINNRYYYIYPFLLNEFIKIRKIKILRIIGDNNIKISENCKCYYYSNSQNYFVQ